MKRFARTSNREHRFIQSRLKVGDAIARITKNKSGNCEPLLENGAAVAKIKMERNHKMFLQRSFLITEKVTGNYKILFQIKSNVSKVLGNRNIFVTYGISL